jgi:type I restriction-modification system DNA methylase subunit
MAASFLSRPQEERPVNNFSEKVSFIWSVADLLRGPYRPNQYKDGTLPTTVLRRLDRVLEPTKDQVLARLEGGKIENLEPILNRAAIENRLPLPPGWEASRQTDSAT